MSVYADGCGRIRLVRGDSGALTVSCETLEGEPRPFAAGERVVFTVKERYTDPAPKLVKEVTTFTEAGEAVLRFQSADTRGAGLHGVLLRRAPPRRGRQRGHHRAQKRVSRRGGGRRWITAASGDGLRPGSA